MEFGRNGAVLRTDKETEREHFPRPGNDVDLCIQSVASITGYTAMAAYARLHWPDAISSGPFLVLVAVGFVFAVLPVAFAFAARAVTQHKLPESAGLPPQYHHVGGWSAFVAIVVLGLVAALAIQASVGLANNQHLEIPGYWGDIVIASVASVFAVAIFGPRLAHTSPFRAFRGLISWIDKRCSGLGHVVSTIDSWLVFVIAPMVGVTQKRTRIRYGLLFGNLAPCCFAAWYLPAPAGLVPIAWSFLIIASVARRWAWIEDDREVAMLTADFTNERLRVGFEEDLSDETLWSYLSLIALLPLAMHQFNEWGGGDVFKLKDAIPAERLSDFWAWLAYYGTELAKAIPFVDWSEIYDVRGASDILLSKPASHHVLFGVRAITDLAFMAVLLQAIAIAARTRKQMELFRDPSNPLDRLDPFVEPIELKRLVAQVDGAWVAKDHLVNSFPKYNARRLHELRRSSEQGSPIHAAATALLHRNKDFSEPIEKLAEVAGAKKLDRAKLGVAWQRVASANAYDLESLAFVRQALNWKSGIEHVREQVAQAIADDIPPSVERTNVLRRMLADSTEKDSLGPVRLLTIRPLMIDWRISGDTRIVEAIRRAASDAAGPVRTAAKAALAEIEAGGPRHPGTRSNPTFKPESAGKTEMTDA